MFNRNLLAAAALAVAAGAVFAQSTPAPAPAASMPRVDQRLANDQARIKAGKESGELTKPEAQKLQAEQRAVKRQERKAEADGTVTPQERRKLARMQNRESRDIHREKHDAQTRPASAPAPAQK